MALVSREVASYPMQGAMERPPAPTLSPVTNPFLCLSRSLSLSLSLSRPLPLSIFSLAYRQRPLFVRRSQAKFHRSSSVFECVELPESHLRNQRWSFLVPSSPTIFPLSLSATETFHTESYSFHSGTWECLACRFHFFFFV